MNNFLTYNLKNWDWLKYFFIFSFSFIVFLYLLVPPGILCPDGFFHTKMALLLKEQGVIKNFPWTQFTTYKDLFVDHHFLYHLFLVPFLSLPSPQNMDIFSLETDFLIKAKLATAFLASLTFLILYWFCRRMKIKGSLIWTMTGFLIPAFLFRLSLIRAPGISIIILLLSFYFILKNKYSPLFLLSFIYVWTYGAWPLLIIVIFLYCFAGACQKLNNQRNEIYQKIKNQKLKCKIKIQNSKIFKIYIVILHFVFCILHFIRSIFSKNNIKLIIACMGGIFVGLVVNPYFPKTFPFYWLQTFKIAFLNYQSKIGVGAEWYPPNLKTFFINVLPVFIPWIISWAWFAFKIKKHKKSSWFFGFISLFFFFYTLKSFRNIEYFIPFSIVFNGLIFSQIIKKINWQDIKNNFKACFNGPNNIFYFIAGLFLIVCVSISFGFYLNSSIKNLHQEYQRNGRPLNHLQMASTWLKNHANPEEIVFQSNWGIFPQLFYFNSQNYYINGLDQTFMYEYSKELYQDWFDLVAYKTGPEKAAKILKENFKASYVLADKNDERFVKLIKKSIGLIEVYQDEQAIIYRINYVN